MAEIKAELEKVRNTKSTRIWILLLVGAVLFVLWWMGKIKTAFAVGLGIVLLAAIGIQTFDYDLDLGALWAGKSIAESRVQQTKDGIKLMGSCVKAVVIKPDSRINLEEREKIENKYDLNCDNFKTQDEAQEKYDTCADQIASYNVGLDKAKVKSLDIYGLDGNKNGVVCESLPRLKPAL